MTTPIYINITICPLEQVTEAIRQKMRCSNCRQTFQYTAYKRYALKSMHFYLNR